MSYPDPTYFGDNGEVSGAPREAYFAGILELASMSDEEKADFYLRHDNIWVEG